MNYLYSADGTTVTEYPYTFRDLRSSNPGISYPAEPSDAKLAEWGVYAVTPTSKPAYDLNFNIVEGTPTLIADVWTQVWTQVAATAEQIANRIANAKTESEQAEVKADAFVQNFITLTPAEVSTYVDANTQDVAEKGMKKAAGGGGGTPPTVFALSPIYLNAFSGTIAWPASHAVDDIAILHLVNRGTDVGVTLPSGFTAFAAHPNINLPPNVGFPQQSLFWRRATSTSETAAAISDGGQRTYGRMIVVRGCVTTGTPFDEGTAYATTGTVADFSVPAVTSSVNDCLILCLVEITGSPSDTSYLEAGFTNAALTSVTNEHEDNTIEGNDYGTYAASGILTTAGSSGATTGTWIQSKRTAGIQIAMKPA
jgi:hypothetical protein